MSAEQNTRTVFFVSDRTGRTAESIGESLLSQFDSIHFIHKSYPFITSKPDVLMVAEAISREFKMSGNKPLIFSTLVDLELQELLSATDACVINLFSSFIGQLEKELHVESSHRIGRPHEEYDDMDYSKRIDAIDYSMKNDDGISVNKLEEADVIIIGVSRSAKTPTCIYLALNFSIKAANYPLTDDDLVSETLPTPLAPYASKMIGLTIDPEQLSAIREQRRPNSKYASLRQCKKEIQQAEMMMGLAGITVMDSTAISIEEIAVKIVKEKQLLK